MARPDKEASVAEITERFNDSDAALLTEYRGLRVSEIAEVRNSLRESDTEYKVLKNTLARIAVREVGLEELVEMLTGPTAIAFIKGDAAAAAKALDDAAKKFPVLAIKGGVLNGKVITAEQAGALAKLEPRDVLLAKIAMLMNMPAQQTVNVFAALLRDLGSMLAQVVAKKESGELAGGAGAPPAAAAEHGGGDEVAPVTAPDPTDGGADAGEAAAETGEADQPGDAAEEGGGEEVAPVAAPDPTGEADQPGDALAVEAAAAPDVAAEEADAPAELAEAVDQAPAAPESEPAQTQEIETADDSTTKEEE
ncbi:MAG TPA: 50S ribosomal protein L10 [Actinomycetota bacterium]|nr:50S ribosomal protein L10 [Actinomycetota bacterium]